MRGAATSNTLEIEFLSVLHSLSQNRWSNTLIGVHSNDVQHWFCYAMKKVDWVFGLKFEYLDSKNFIKLDKWNYNPKIFPYQKRSVTNQHVNFSFQTPPYISQETENCVTFIGMLQLLLLLL